MLGSWRKGAKEARVRGISAVAEALSGREARVVTGLEDLPRSIFFHLTILLGASTL